MTAALGLLENLWNDLPQDVDPRLRFRIQANIAACNLRLGQISEGAAIYTTAYKHAPKEPKALPLRILGLILSDRPEEALREGMEAIGGPSDQVLLAAHILNAKSRLPKEVNPFGFIPSKVENDVSVLIGKIDYHRAHAERASSEHVDVSAPCRERK